MPADLQPLGVGADMVGVVDHPRGEPDQLALDLRQCFQFPQALSDRPYLVHAQILDQSAGLENRGFLGDDEGGWEAVGLVPNHRGEKQTFRLWQVRAGNHCLFPWRVFV